MSEEFMMHLLRNIFLLTVAFAHVDAVKSQEVEAFYRGKTVSVVAGTGPVGTYAGYAQLFAEFMPRHLPGRPTMVFQSMPGAGGLTAANHTFNVAPKDGTYLLVIVQTFAVEQALGTKAVRYESSAFNTIGRIVDNTPVLVGSSAAGITSIDIVRQRETMIAGAGASSPTDIVPKLLNASAGTKFKLITGYKGIDDMMLAMQRGEAEAMVASLSTFQSLFSAALSEKKIRILTQLSVERHRDLPNVPTVGELSASSEGRELADLVASGSDIGRTLVTTPGIPSDRLKVLRAAFEATINDSEFQDAARKRQLPIDPRNFSDVEKIIAQTLKASPEVVEKARVILDIR
jgi:tripartite-type tricarboxylate transporter receptor subunit TctC